MIVLNNYRVFWIFFESLTTFRIPRGKQYLQDVIKRYNLMRLKIIVEKKKKKEKLVIVASPERIFQNRRPRPP